VQVENSPNKERTKRANIRKMNYFDRMKGKSYKAVQIQNGTKMEVTRRARFMGDRCGKSHIRPNKISKHPHLKCQEVKDEQCPNIFDNFWQMNWQQRRVFVATSVDVLPKSKTGNEKSRSFYIQI
jgi:hypothetical protein